MIIFSDIPSSPSSPGAAYRRVNRKRGIKSTWSHYHRLIWAWTMLVLFLPWYCKAVTKEGKPVVCAGRTIFNDVKELASLRNCSIIEGNLELLLITKEVNWSDVVLPELREITGMLVLYRVYHLSSLRHLLPKLSVIRGEDTLMGYSLVIYQAIHLERLELTQLRTIQNGSVRIQDNHHLCYVKTVKWRRIILGDEEEKIERNGDACLDCPSSCGADVGCWGPEECQQVAPSSCPHSYLDENTCCDHSCLGGCWAANSSRACFACIHLLSSNICVDTCYMNEYKYQNRRCLSETECRRADPKNKILRADSSKGYEAGCVSQCPGKMTVRGTSPFCEPCKDGDVCEKTCPGQHVNTIEEAKSFEGCTIINGTLQLSINGGKDITTDLTKYFQNIHQVTEYIHIFHSAFLSLEFFRSLSVIDGESLENGKYALYVRDNKVLEDIWNWSPNRSLTIKKGSVFFHSNPKLCHEKIEELLNRTIGVSRNESAIKLNGGNAECRVNSLEVDVEAVPNRLGELNVTWKQVSTPDARALLGYNVYYRTTEFRNLTIYNNRDACNEPWEMKYKDANHTSERMWLLLENLIPNTQYAVYVETDIILSTDTGARSNISYPVTEPFNPGRPQNARLRSTDNGDLEVTWEPPLDPNGQLDVYWLHATKVEPRPIFSENDTFCEKPLTEWRAMHQAAVENEDVEDELHQPQPPREEDCCSCKSPPQDFEETRRQKIASKLFEDALYHLVYSNNTNSAGRRHRRSIGYEDDAEEEYLRLGLNRPNEIVLTRDKSLKLEEKLQGENETLVLVSANKRKYQFRNVRPFKQYKVEVVACQGPKDCPDKIGKCRLCSRKPYLERRIYIKGKDDDNVLQVSMDQGQVSFMFPEGPTASLVGFIIRCFNLDTLTQLNCRFWSKNECSNNMCKVNLPADGPGTFNVSITTVRVDRIGQNVSLTYHIESKGGIPWVPILSSLTLALAVVAIVVMVWRRKQTDTEPPNVPSHVSQNPMYLRLRELYKIEEKYIHHPNNLKIYEDDREGVLGKGNFGVVKRGDLRLFKDGGPNEKGDDYEEVPVAVKQVTTYLGSKSASEEAALMLKFKCFHLVRLYGVVPVNDTVYLVMELMKGGDLKKYLKSLIVTGGSIFSALSHEKVHAMAVQIADGMAYLAAKKMVHRDLAARNCLLDENLNVKISDFGMTRIADNEYYRMNNSTLLPMRWMPPESLREFYFTSQSDVWSYGVVVWEILTGGARPYENMNERQVSDYVKCGNTLESSLPDDTPPYLANLLVQCWQFFEQKRPNFFQIVALLEQYTSPAFQRHFRLVSFYNSPECDEFRHHMTMNGASLYSTNMFGFDSTSVSSIK